MSAVDDWATRFLAEDRRVAGWELIDAYMALHPEWTTRAVGPDPYGCGSVWIETWESRMVAGAQYSGEEARSLGLGAALYAHTFVAVSVAEGFAALTKEPR